MMKRRRFWLITFVLLASTGGYWWFCSRLTIAERQLVGTWVCDDKYDDGATCKRTWEARPDGTLRFRNVYHWVATELAPARNEVNEGELNWSYRGSRLIVTPQHPPGKRLRILVWILERRVRNMFGGISEIVMDTEGSNGRLSHIDGDSFTVHWWNPDKRAESPPVTYRSVR